MRLRSLTTHLREQNWFAVALDFVIVVLGVGVALLGQQWLSDRQQQADMASAEIVLQGDLFKNYFVAKERVAVTDCRVEAYQEIAEKLLAPGDDWTGMPRSSDDIVFKSALPNLLRSPSRSWGSATWDAELSRGTFNQMDDVRRATYDSIFSQATAAGQLQDDIWALQGQLKVLAVSARLSQSDRLRYYDTLGALDDNGALLELMASQIIERVEALGIDFEPEDQAELQVMLEGARAYGAEVYGDCFGPFEWPIIDLPAKQENAP